MAGDFEEQLDDMEEVQLQQLYLSFAVGFFRNNLIPVKETDLEAHTTRLKREFRWYCGKAFGFNPLTVSYANPDKWSEWTWLAMQMVLA